MSYEPTTWATGDIITATKLNNIESGVQSVSSSYTPTTWATGDIITATKLNNIEQGIADAGGGGSSDFSTAQVTLINNSGANTGIVLSVCYESDPYFDEPALTSGFCSISNNETLTRTVPIYKNGSAEMYSGEVGDMLQGVSIGKKLTVTNGSAEKAGRRVYITGDCTITIS